MIGYCLESREESRAFSMDSANVPDSQTVRYNKTREGEIPVAPQSAHRVCIYCGQNVGRVRKGEHIIPEAIGGALTIKNVCGRCNNGFSQIDAELCSRSFLSIVASQQMDAHLWQAWDVDHSAANLLLEARPDWAAESLALYPQMVFERAGPQLRGDHREMARFGQENFEKVFVKSMLRAFRRHEAGVGRCLHFERVENQAIERGYRLPPRIFPRMSVQELADRLGRGKTASFVLRYQTESDRRFALNVLNTWNYRGTFRSLERGIGSELPIFGCFFDAGRVLRALSKLAVNLLSHCCPNSPINRMELRDVIRVIRWGESAVSNELLSANGFVHALDIEPIKAGSVEHSFRLLHMDAQWYVYSSFFGGRIGSFVRFPGPNREDWCCADIMAPLRSKAWTIRTSSILQPLKVHIEWQDVTKLVPTIKMLHTEAKLLVESDRGHRP